MNDTTHTSQTFPRLPSLRSLLDGIRSAFVALPSREAPASAEAIAQKRRLAHALLACDPGIAADLFAEADREEARLGR